MKTQNIRHAVVRATLTRLAKGSRAARIEAVRKAITWIDPSKNTVDVVFRYYSDLLVDDVKWIKEPAESGDFALRGLRADVYRWLTLHGSTVILETCLACGQVALPGMRILHVSEEAAIRCDKCLHICPVCGTNWVAEMEKCTGEGCETVACPNCLTRCEKCNDTLCAPCLESDGSTCTVCKKYWCSDCSTTNTCSSCNEDVCATCAHNCDHNNCTTVVCDDCNNLNSCDHCDGSFCSEHLHTCSHSRCESTSCEHCGEMSSCSECNESICESHREFCTACESHFCSRHAEGFTSVDGEAYCESCSENTWYCENCETNHCEGANCPRAPRPRATATTPTNRTARPAPKVIDAAKTVFKPYPGLPFRRLFGLEVEICWAGRNARYIKPPIGWQGHADGSLVDGGYEFISPPMWGGQAVDMMKGICEAARTAGFTDTDYHSGMHMHVDARDLGWGDVTKIALAWLSWQNAFGLLVKKSRVFQRNSHYCEPHGVGRHVKLLEVKSKSDLLNWIYDTTGTYKGNSDTRATRTEKYHGNRYRSLNFHAWKFMGTLEFRTHHGTIDFDTMYEWAYLIERFVERASVATWQEVHDLPLTDEPSSSYAGYPEYLKQLDSLLNWLDLPKPLIGRMYNRVAGYHPELATLATVRGTSLMASYQGASSCAASPAVSAAR